MSSTKVLMLTDVDDPIKDHHSYKLLKAALQSSSSTSQRDDDGDSHQSNPWNAPLFDHHLKTRNSRILLMEPYI